MNELYDELAAKLSGGLSLLPDKPEETTTGTLRALWHAADGEFLSVQEAETLDLPVLSDAGVSRLRELVSQRLSGTPLAHLTGRQRFMGLDMLVGPEALIPRKETEILGYTALELLQELVTGQDTAMVIDVCTGSGNLVLAMAHHQPKTRTFGADLSDDAICLARRNAAHLGLDGRVQFLSGDLLTPFDTAEFHGNVDLLTCNPPYISSKKVDGMPGEIISHEPRLAFDGGPLGIRIVEKLIREAPRYVRKGGYLAFEIGLGQGPAMSKRLNASGNYSVVRTVCDDHGDIRVLVARV